MFKEVGPKELEADDFSVEVIVLAMPSQGGRIMKWPTCNWHMKEEQRLGKVHEVALKAQATTSEMAIVMCAKVETVQEHTTLQLFIMHVDLLVFHPKEKRYFQPQRSEELAKLKWQLSLPQNSTLLPHNLTHVFVVMVTKIKTYITMDIATTIAMPACNFV